MDRIKIELPAQFAFQTEIAVQIGDINYGNHLANDAVLRLCHEARLRFLRHFGFTEQNVGGCGLIMADAAIRFVKQAFYGDELIFAVAVGDISRAGFSLITRITRVGDGAEIARVKNGMVFFDYERQAVTAVPAIFRETFAAA